MYIVRYRCIPFFSRVRCVRQCERKFHTMREALYEAQSLRNWVLPNGRNYVRGAVTVTYR